jgi:hypothetical protein
MRQETEKHAAQNIYSCPRTWQLRLAFHGRPLLFDSGQRTILGDSAARSGIVGEDLAEGDHQSIEVHGESTTGTDSTT